MTTNVVSLRLFGQSHFELQGIWESLIVIVDYTEVPVILATTAIYIHQLTKGFSWRPVLMILLLNSQWLHIFWITDEFVVAQFLGVHETLLPVWLAWVAIGIDYLEIPVIYDTTRNFLISLKKKISE
jgi:signal transduction histidine kinase